MSIKRDMLKEKLFDARLYNTIFINKADEDRVRHEQMGVLVELLTDDKHKSAQTEVFTLLKKEKQAVDLLIRAINETKEKRNKLVAACWEADVDCDRHLSLFTDLLLNDELSVAMEALTVIENMRGHSSQADIESALSKANERFPKEASNPKGQLITDFIEVLKGWQK